MKRAIIGTFALSLAAGVAYAQENTAPAGGASQSGAASLQFSTVDTDNDGRVSSAEAQAHPALRSDFARLDENSDGYLSQAEFDKLKSGSSPGSSSSGPSTAPPVSPGASSTPGSSSDPGTRSTEPAEAAPQSDFSDPAE